MPWQTLAFAISSDGVAKNANYCVALALLSLRRRLTTPHSSGFERLAFGVFLLGHPC